MTDPISPNELLGIAHRIQEPLTAASPLASADADALTAMFTADPRDLTDAQLDQMIGELRRRRDAFLSAEAATAAKGKRARAERPAPTTAEAATLDKPAAETTLDDLL